MTTGAALPPTDERPLLTEQEKAALVERHKRRMAEPGYRESLVDPPADVQRPEPLTEHDG